MHLHRRLLLFSVLAGMLTIWAFSVRYFDRVNTAMNGEGDCWGYYVSLLSLLNLLII